MDNFIRRFTSGDSGESTSTGYEQFEDELKNRYLFSAERNVYGQSFEDYQTGQPPVMTPEKEHDIENHISPNTEVHDRKEGYYAYMLRKYLSLIHI